MAIETGTSPSGAGLKTFARAPDFPGEVGKIDVKGIYDRVAQALGNAKAIPDATRAALVGNQDALTATAVGPAQRSLIPAQTEAAGAEAGQRTAQARLGTERAGFLSSIPNPYLRENVLAGRVPGSTTKRTTFDPKTQSVLSTEETTVPAAGGAGAAVTGSVHESQYAPISVESMREHTDPNGNIITNIGVYRVVDATKPAFNVNQETGQIEPILDPATGQPTNATLVGAKGTAARGTYGGGGVAGLENVLAALKAKLGENDPQVIQLEAALPGILLKGQATAAVDPNAPKGGNLGEAERTTARLDDLHKQIGEATTKGDTALAAALTASAKVYQTNLDAINAGRSHAKPATGLERLRAPGDASATPGAGAPPPAPAALQGPALQAADKAAFDALPAGAPYNSGGVQYFKGQR